VLSFVCATDYKSDRYIYVKLFVDSFFFCLKFILLGAYHKRRLHCSRGKEEGCPLRIFQMRKFKFLLQNFQIFRKLWSHGQKSWGIVQIFFGQGEDGSIFRDFVRMSFMNSPISLIYNYCINKWHKVARIRHSTIGEEHIMDQTFRVRWADSRKREGAHQHDIEMVQLSYI